MKAHRSLARATSVLGVCVLVAATAGMAAPATAVAASLPAAPACPMFPADSFWHADVSRLPVDANSATYVASAGRHRAAARRLRIGHLGRRPDRDPVQRRARHPARGPVSFDYADESDPGPYPIPANAAHRGRPGSAPATAT